MRQKIWEVTAGISLFLLFAYGTRSWAAATFVAVLWAYEWWGREHGGHDKLD